MTKSNPAKDEEQLKALRAWASLGFKGTLQACTGFGKTYTAIRAVARLSELSDKPLKVLILTPTEVIRDKSWKDEFHKWGQGELFNNCVEVVCIQTAYKWKNREYDIVIADEVHNYLSPKYSRFFLRNKIHKLLGLSAKISPDRLDVLNKIGAKIVYTLTTEEAKEKNIVSDFTIYNIPVYMTEEEKERFEVIENRFSYLEFQLGGKFSAFDTANKWLKSPEQQKSRLAGAYFGALQARRSFLYNLQSKVEASHALMEEVKKRGKLSIVFSQSIDFAKKLIKDRKDSVLFHSKMGTVERRESLSKFGKKRFGKIQKCFISSVEALNEGWNVPAVDTCIITAYTSSEKAFIQRVGRGIRWEEGKVGRVYCFYVPGTQEEKWLQKAQRGFTAGTVKYVKDLNEALNNE